MPDFKNRSSEPELMDDLESGGQVIEKTLDEITFINHWLGGNAVTINGIDRLLKNWDRSKPLTILDFGCGDGTMLILMLKWLKKNGFEATLVGVDANPHIVRYAQNVVKDYPEIEIRTGNAFDDYWVNFPCNIITSTLFTHHFTDEQLVDLFKKWYLMASEGVVINDLHRHWFAFYSIKTLTQVFSRSSMVRYDAPLSVLRAFKKKELRDILQTARIDKYYLEWEWAFRWELVIPLPSPPR